ncbi:Predicted DNA-binding transcriptional regulator YafY, contains an HTH and WYL domains [Cribrihabitans marinus]|uniref:Predicted DNA-binding transcriptional regulator YafY, contains an HTH and WYL domains n=1 Tax=Cribrihabitans marinus TaxID=1227549 RepID=A0A1H7DV40_9RHOB|nr:WYL domain-containing protein [Cribrihabitans marinus]GGH40160.1 WYL domain-containing protein [Cribrihabitans marinus]SEK05294.1 Predicted DNA-binding transcriptional regulator YafY, contains an HTH and WYL domains [Cribrihabitans marinus]
MSYAKAADLLRVAEMAMSRFDGIALQDLTEEFGCDHRTAQRMMRSFETVFPQVDIREDGDRRRRWHLPRHDPRWLQAQGIRDSELAALELAIKRAERDGAPDEAKRLQVLRDRLLAAMPSSLARRAEADAEALLEAQGFASRPGPRVVSDLSLLGALTEALRAPFTVEISYTSADGRTSDRLLEPYGLLLGIRRYLVARPVAGDGKMRRFRLDRIAEARITGKSFARDPAFDLGQFASQAFGSFHSDAEYGPVAWRFSPEAASVARQFVFHPSQEMLDESDGSLIVRFEASGHLEMAWHLYQWGNDVEVLAPKALRDMVAGHRRADFPALP